MEKKLKSISMNELMLIKRLILSNKTLFSFFVIKKRSKNSDFFDTAQTSFTSLTHLCSS